MKGRGVPIKVAIIRNKVSLHLIFNFHFLVSTSYATDSKKAKYDYDDSIYHQLPLFELESPQYDEDKAKSKGKIFTLTRDKNASGNMDIDDLE